MSVENKRDPQHLLKMARRRLGMSVIELSGHLHISPRTHARWATGRSEVPPMALVSLARLVQPIDSGLAAALAGAAGTTLPAAPATPASSALLHSTLLPRHLADSIVCAAADHLSVGTVALRPALIAAFARAEAVGFTLATAREALLSEEPSSPPAPA